MHRIQFEYNKTELELLDNELMEDNVNIFLFLRYFFFSVTQLFYNFVF